MVPYVLRCLEANWYIMIHLGGGHAARHDAGGAEAWLPHVLVHFWRPVHFSTADFHNVRVCVRRAVLVYGHQSMQS